MKRKQTTILLLTLSLFALLLAACTAGNEEQPPVLINDLLQMTLERALVSQEIPDYQLLVHEREEIVLSTENIDPAFTPQLPGHTIIMMSPEEIQAKADAEGDFPFLRFQQVDQLADDEVHISLGSTMAIAADSEMLYLAGGGFTLEFSRTRSGWESEITEQWIS